VDTEKKKNDIGLLAISKYVHLTIQDILLNARRILNKNQVCSFLTSTLEFRCAKALSTNLSIAL
jgi:hypothetical protein